MRWTVALLPVIALTLGCSTLHSHDRTILTGAEPFIAARRFVVSAHTHPRLNGARRSMEHVGSNLRIKIEIPHTYDRDVVTLSFSTDGTGTRIKVHQTHVDSYGRKSACTYATNMEAVVFDILTRGALETDEDLGTMALSSAASY